MSIEQLIKEPWYNDFLSRLKAKDESLCRKELKKQEKSYNINFRAEDEEDDIF